MSALALVLIGGTAGGTAAMAAAHPTPITTAGGLQANGARPSSEPAAYTGDCELPNVTCNPGRAGSCAGDSSQTTFPSAIKVLVRTQGTGSFTITSVPFESYVENVLPNEWVPTWDGDALKAGAVAVKSYAWFWHTHFGGYANGNPAQCFDVTDDTDFQVYRAGSAQSRTTAAVEQSWPVVARVGTQVLEAQYRGTLTGHTNETCGAGANGAMLSQNGTQNCIDSDLHRGGNTGNKYNVILGKYYYPGLQLATSRQLRTPDDFTFEQTSTRAFFHSGSWTLSDGYGTHFSLGLAGDIPTVRNVGDGFARIGVFRPSTGTWYLGTPQGGVASQVKFGLRGDIPVQAAYNGNEHPTVLAVFRPRTATWYLDNKSDPVQFGRTGDIPVPGHYVAASGDHYAPQLAVFRPSNGTWYIDNGSAPIQFGRKGDIPVPADYNGDGKTDIAVYRPSTHTFYVRGGRTLRYGLAGDVPVSGDFNGDGKADFAVYRPSNQTWYAYGQASHVFGLSSGTPIGAAPQH